MWTDDEVRAAMVERLDILVECCSIGRDLDAIEQQYGAHADILAARERLQRQCLALLMHLIVAMLPSRHVETVH